MPLRDLAEADIYAPDTLFLLPTASGHDGLEALASGWEADEIDWLDVSIVARAMHARPERNPLFPDVDRAVLRLWWD